MGGRDAGAVHRPLAGPHRRRPGDGRGGDGHGPVPDARRGCAAPRCPTTGRSTAATSAPSGSTRTAPSPHEVVPLLLDGRPRGGAVRALEAAPGQARYAASAGSTTSGPTGPRPPTSRPTTPTSSPPCSTRTPRRPGPLARRRPDRPGLGADVRPVGRVDAPVAAHDLRPRPPLLRRRVRPPRPGLTMQSSGQVGRVRRRRRPPCAAPRVSGSAAVPRPAGGAA